ncbi:tetraspanin-33 isoform X3 [Nematostella vectensis]|uniref:tetraspanin-33 isoform X3 n=1 Tax=Nematostella vectensis TaxID=45351 RepID=UPI0020775BD1|nr:tetraspanin-33 isoform X3 [Nematostella vectensis]
MDLHCLSKYFIFTLNFIVWVVSIVFIGVGSWAHSEKDMYNTMGNLVASPSIILIAYMVVLAVLFTSEIIAGFLSFFFVEETRSKVSSAIKLFVVHYQDDLDLQNAIDGIQSNLKCCGGYSYHDWNHNKYFNCSAQAVEACGVPHSCCVEDQINTQCGFGVRREKSVLEASSVIYVRGCVDSLSDWMVENLHIIGGLAFGFAAIQLLSILGASNLIKDIEQAIAISDKLHADAHNDFVYT